MFLGFEHSAIAAADSDGLTRWYCETFGLAVIYDNKQRPGVYLLQAPDGSILEILPAEKGEPSDYPSRQIGLRHLALSVSDFAQAGEYLAQRGVSFFDLRELNDGAKLAFFRDPEGNLLHLIWRPKALSPT